MRACAALLWVLCSSAFAQNIYSWEDAQGVHFTDDLSQVPKKAKVEAQVAEVHPAPKNAPAPSAPPVASSPSPPDRGPDERQWRERFIGVYRRLAMLKESLSALRATLPSPTICFTHAATQTQISGPNGVRMVTNPPITQCQVNPEYDRIRVLITQQEVDLHTTELDLEQLDRQASYDAVPREWRRGW